MSGFLALLDDVATLARLTATQVDDIAGHAAKVGGKIGASVIDDAAKAGAKAAGVVVDDAAVTPKYVTGLPATRELPMIWKIARGSVFNKVVILLPVALLLSLFAPWLLSPLLMLGGAYLSFEGAEKVLHVVAGEKHHDAEPQALDAAHLEQQRVKSAIKTDFILSAEIMVLSLATIETPSLVSQAIILAVVAVGITALVYGSVAILVKADDVGLKIAQIGRLPLTRRLGRAVVKGMPAFMTLIATVGTAAMLWVGGSIILHGLDDLGWHAPYATIHHWAEGIADAAPAGKGAVAWIVTAALDGLVGLMLGFVLIPVTKYAIAPVTGAVTGMFRRRKTA